jgi:hypothetical protein
VTAVSQGAKNGTITRSGYLQGVTERQERRGINNDEIKLILDELSEPVESAVGKQGGWRGIRRP